LARDAAGVVELAWADRKHTVRRLHTHAPTKQNKTQLYKHKRSAEVKSPVLAVHTTSRESTRIRHLLTAKEEEKKNRTETFAVLLILAAPPRPSSSPNRK
jgi:hypothetical protein